MRRRHGYNALARRRMLENEIGLWRAFRPLMLVLAFCGIALIWGVAGGLRRAAVAHWKIQVGMTAAQVVEILSAPRGRHSYHIKALDQTATRECESSKVQFESCRGSNMSLVDCYKQFPAWETNGLCRGRSYFVPAEFLKGLEDLSRSEIPYVSLEIFISATYMGPAFLHNSFRINFGRDGRVTSVTEVRHWD